MGERVLRATLALVAATAGSGTQPVLEEGPTCEPQPDDPVTEADRTGVARAGVDTLPVFACTGGGSICASRVSHDAITCGDKTGNCAEGDLKAKCEEQEDGTCVAYEYNPEGRFGYTCNSTDSVAIEGSPTFFCALQASGRPSTARPTPQQPEPEPELLSAGAIIGSLILSCDSRQHAAYFHDMGLSIGHGGSGSAVGAFEGRIQEDVAAHLRMALLRSAAASEQSRNVLEGLDQRPLTAVEQVEVLGAVEIKPDGP